MGLLDNLAASLQNVVTTVSERAEQFKNQSFADACMASCALVTMADGVMQPEERTKVVACIQNIRDLHCFKATDLRDSFDNFCRQSGEVFSRVDVVKAIRKVRSDPDQADMVVKIGIIIAKSKGALAEVEKTVLREIIHELGLNVDDYDLGSPALAAASGTTSGAATTTASPSPGAAVVTPRPAPLPTPAPMPSPAVVREPSVQGGSLKEVKPGERVSLKQLAGAVSARLEVDLAWRGTAGNLTASALVFDKDKKFVRKVALGAATADGIAHAGNIAGTLAGAGGYDEQIVLDMAAITAAASLVFVVRASDGKPVQGVSGIYLRITDPDKRVQLLRFEQGPKAAAAAFIVGRVYLNNGDWKFAAIGDAVLSGDAEAQIASFA